MIAFFPSAYPDELLYSRICRYHIRSGNYCTVFTFDDIYCHRTVHPDMEFLNRFSGDAMGWICGDCGFEDIIIHQTMYPFYARFLPKERRNRAFQALLAQEGNWYNLLCVPQVGARFLRYCPLCAAEDRELYGETYWHRRHQIQRVRICSRHGCNLINSEIRIASKTKPGLFDAESNVPSDSTADMCDNQREIEFVQYLVDVGERPVDLETEVTIGLFLHDKLGDYYAVKSRLVVDMDRLYTDYCKFYVDIPVANRAAFQKILNNYYFDTYFVLTLSFFLGLTVDHITALPKRLELNGIDRLYADLAQKYSIDIQTVTAIGEEVLRFSHNHSYVRRRSGVRSKDWARLDNELLPLVQKAVLEVLNVDGRPQKLSVAMIQKKLGLPQKQLDKLPTCKQFILDHMESQPEYWAREIEWLISVLHRQGIVITTNRIVKALNLRKNDILESVPFIQDETIKELILEILQGNYNSSSISDSSILSRE